MAKSFSSRVNKLNSEKINNIKYIYKNIKNKKYCPMSVSLILFPSTDIAFVSHIISCIYFLKVNIALVSGEGVAFTRYSLPGILQG